MRILFIGTVLFPKNILDEILKSKNKIVGVIGKNTAENFEILKETN